MKKLYCRAKLGEVSEWFKELVLKTSDPERDRGFESHLLRLAGRLGEIPKRLKGLPWKGSRSLKRCQGSNPCFSVGFKY